MNSKELLASKFETLILAFFNVKLVNTKSGSHFVIPSKWMTQLKHESDRKYGQTAKQLGMKYGLLFTQTGTVEISAVVENEDGLSIVELRKQLYLRIASLIPQLPEDYPLDMELALAMFLLRGSPDTKLGYYSVDFIEEDDTYLSNFLKILLSSNELFDRLNFNFRNLQKQYVSGQNKRNTQVRINLKFFYDRIMLENSGLNPYKFEALKNNIADLGDVRTYPSFEERVVFYTSKVLNRALSSDDIEKLRQDLSFSSQASNDIDTGVFSARNQKIISFARETFPDECVGCSADYPVEARSFVMPRNNRYYFEINHVIPYANDSNAVDVLDNLVKLCATCHRALTPRRASDSLQTTIIRRMLESRDEVKNFVNSMISDPKIDAVAFVHQSLK